MRDFFCEEKGLTLVEMIIAISIMGFVLALAYLLFFFGNSSFDRGTAQAHVQQNVRLVDELLKRELRNADFLDISTGVEPEIFTGAYKVEGGCFNQNDSPITAAVITDVEVWIRDESDRAVCAYKITGADGGQEFNISNEVLLNNIALDDLTSFIIGQVYSLNTFTLYYDQ